MAYVVKAESKADLVIPFLPVRTQLEFEERNVWGGGWNVQVELQLLDRENELDVKALSQTFAEVLEEGKTYPQEGPLDLDGFKAYYLSHEVFVLKDVAASAQGEGGEGILGAFYIKPNFPGRCNHICNHGGKGIGTLLAKLSLPLTKLLGYRAVYYNLVFTDNTYAIRIYEKLGFKRTGYIPKAGRVGDAFQDAIQLHFDLDDLSYGLKDFETT